MKPPRGLSPEEAAAWARLASTVKPLIPPSPGEGDHPQGGGGGPAVANTTPGLAPPKPLKQVKGRIPPPLPTSSAPAPKTGPGLDSHWDRRLARRSTEPDFTLDLHGHTLDQAHRRLDQGLTQARTMDARLVLVVTGKPRPVDAADRGQKRGAIRAKIVDWLAAGPHASAIAAIRKAQPRHGGEGALYLVLKRQR